MPNEGTKAVDYVTIFPYTLENGKLIQIRGKSTFKTLTDTKNFLSKMLPLSTPHLVVDNMVTQDLCFPQPSMH